MRALASAFEDYRAFGRAPANEFCSLGGSCTKRGATAPHKQTLASGAFRSAHSSFSLFPPNDAKKFLDSAPARAAGLEQRSRAVTIRLPPSLPGAFHVIIHYTIVVNIPEFPQNLGVRAPRAKRRGNVLVWGILEPSAAQAAVRVSSTRKAAKIKKTPHGRREASGLDLGGALVHRFPPAPGRSPFFFATPPATFWCAGRMACERTRRYSNRKSPVLDHPAANSAVS